MKLSFVTLDVFTDTKWQGNPLAIVLVPHGRDVETPVLQKIAREFNLSETVFLYDAPQAQGQKPVWKMRIFLTNAEVPFAGHPVIGTACYALGTLRPGASQCTLICNAGPIEIDYKNGQATAEIPHNVHIHTEHPITLDQIHVLQPSLKGRIQADAVKAVSPVNGMNFITVQLPDLATLSQITLSAPPTFTPDAGWESGFTGSYFYVVDSSTLNTAGTMVDHNVQSRMIEGAFEDPATGSAACALLAYLALRDGGEQEEVRVVIKQGVEMGRASRIEVRGKVKQGGGAMERVWLGGTAVGVMSGSIEV